MNSDRVLMMLAALAEQSGERVSEFRIEFLATELLKAAEPAVICEALRRLLGSSRRFPTVDEVKASMGMAEPTGRDEAMMLSNAIVAALIKFGWLQPGYVAGAKARELAVGAGAWEVIGRAGGWNALLDRLGENETALRAQLRDLAEAYLKCGVIERGQLPPLNPPSPHMALEAAKHEDQTPKLEEYRADQRRLKIAETIEELRKQRRIAVMQEEHDGRRLPDPDSEEPPF